MKEKVLKIIDLEKLKFKFQDPPLLVSGMAMMYYGLRESSKDTDMVLSAEDHRSLASQLKPQAQICEENHKVGYKESPQFTDLFGDHGILIYEFELWDSIMLFDYEELSINSIQEENFNVIALENLMNLSVIRGINNKRYLDDALLIAAKLSEHKYSGQPWTRNEYWQLI